MTRKLVAVVTFAESAILAYALCLQDLQEYTLPLSSTL